MSKDKICMLYDKIETQLKALGTLGITSDKCATMLLPLIESCLPKSLLRVSQRSSECSESWQSILLNRQIKMTVLLELKIG